jgi:arylsulfatase A-like enzyme
MTLPARRRVCIAAGAAFWVALTGAGWPEPVKAPRDAPNILIIMTDDVGFASASGFGGPVPTPTFDGLAREGLRYNRFHTSAICSPTRAALLTGRNPQEVGMGYVANWATPHEGYTSLIPKSAGTLPRILRDAGYSTAMIGKAHITPEWELGPSGPFDRWPTGLGFDYYFGFLGADTSAFEPNLVENTRYVRAPARPGYHVEVDFADRAINWLSAQEAATPDKPFFLYYATGAAHAPNHADSLARFRGQFDAGWDVMREQSLARQKRLGVIPADTVDAPRPPTLPRWDSLSPERQRLYARYMEAYAASLSLADQQIGRVIAHLKAIGEYDDTLILYIQGDNGASTEGSFDGKLFEQSPLAGIAEDASYAQARLGEIGSASSYPLIPGGWGWAMNAPFPHAKRYGSHFGGTRNPMVLAWKGRIADPGGLRSQFLHVSDVMPTLLDIAGIALPESIDGVKQQPLSGISARYTIAGSTAPSRRTSQAFAMAENMALYQNGWMISSVPMASSWERTRPMRIAPEARRWELYDLDADFSQSRNLAEREPQRLAAMQAAFWREAARLKMLPIHSPDGGQGERPDPARDRSHFVYSAPVRQLPEATAPRIVGRSFEIEAELGNESGAPSGVILAHGGRYGGYSLMVDRGRPVFIWKLTPAFETRLTGPALPKGRANRITVRLKLDREVPGSGAMITLFVNGQPVGQSRADRSFTQIVSHTEGFDIGSDEVTGVVPAMVGARSEIGPHLKRVVLRLTPCPDGRCG